MSKVLVYLHGLGSKGQTLKSEALKAVLAKNDVKFIAPDLPLDPKLVVDHIRQEVTQIYLDSGITKLVFCGTSLGGFYSAYFGESFDAEYVAINPVIHPSEAFRRYIETPSLNYASDLPLEMQPEMLIELAKMEKMIEKPNGYLANIFLAADDDVVPYQSAMNHFKYARWLKVTQDGGHRYDVNWPAVIARVSALFA